MLVTSHTTKALRVLRQLLADELRPLCVSLLDHDSESREQLKESVQGITRRLSTDNQDSLRMEAVRLTEERQFLLKRRNTLKQQLMNARSAEYRDIVLAGETWSPSDAARFVDAGKDKCCWIPGPLAADSPLPLTVDEIYALYGTNSETNLLDAKLVNSPLPALAALLTPEEFEEAVRFIVADNDAVKFDAVHWSIKEFTRGTVRELELAMHDAAKIVLEFGRLENWQVAAVEAGRRGAGLADAWETLIAMVEQTVQRQIQCAS